MDFLLSILPALIFLIFIVAKIFNVFMNIKEKLTSESAQRQGSNKESGTVQAQQEKSFQETVDEEIARDTNGAKSDQSAREPEAETRSQSTGSRSLVDNQILSQKTESTAAAQEIDRQAGVSIDNRQQLIRGIIMKEILDKPRSLRPYQPPYSNF